MYACVCILLTKYTHSRKHKKLKEEKTNDPLVNSSEVVIINILVYIT